MDEALAAVTTRLTAAPRPAGAPPLRVADVGTGSGAIAVALVVGPAQAADGRSTWWSSRSTSRADALDLARENAAGHGVADRMTFREGDLLPVGDTPYAVICANLPYVATEAIEGLARDLAFEPRVALDGGPDGLDEIRRLLDRLPEVLGRDGVALLEIGVGPGRADRRAAAADPLPGWRCAVQADLAGLPRLARIEPPAPSGCARRRGPARREGPSSARPARSPPSRSGCWRSTSTGRSSGQDMQLSRSGCVAAIGEAVRRGVRVSLATGRMPSSAVVFANRLGLAEPIIGHQGAIVRAMPCAGPPRTEAGLVPGPRPDRAHPLPPADGAGRHRGRRRAGASRTASTRTSTPSSG